MVLSEEEVHKGSGTMCKLLLGPKYRGPPDSSSSFRSPMTEARSLRALGNWLDGVCPTENGSKDCVASLPGIFCNHSVLSRSGNCSGGKTETSCQMSSLGNAGGSKLCRLVSPSVPYKCEKSMVFKAASLGGLDPTALTPWIGSTGPKSVSCPGSDPDALVTSSTCSQHIRWSWCLLEVLCHHT